MKRAKLSFTLIVLTLLIFGGTGCGKTGNTNDISISAEGTGSYPVEVPTNATIKSYPSENILGLKSVCTFVENGRRTLILEFLKEELDLTKEELEAIEDNKKISLGSENMVIQDYQITEDIACLYLIIGYSSAEEAERVKLYGYQLFYQITLLNNMKLETTYYNVVESGKWGTRRLIQDYDATTDMWKEVETVFFEDSVALD